jgi:hypothetical protein
VAIDFTPGDRITAARLNAFVPKYLYQSSDQTLNTTSMTNHNTFANVAVAAGETWEFCFNLVIGNSTAASDMKTDLNVSGTVTTSLRHIFSIGASATQSFDIGNVNVQARDTTADVSHGVVASASVFATLQEKVVVFGGASGGTLSYRWSCVAASGNVSVLAGSHMIAHRVE